MTNRPPEVELLLRSAPTRTGAETVEQIHRLLQANLDWTYLQRLAGQHGMLPLAYRKLSTTAPEQVPPTVLAQLRDHCHANSVRNLGLTVELLKLLDLFAGQ